MIGTQPEDNEQLSSVKVAMAETARFLQFNCLSADSVRYNQIISVIFLIEN